MNPFPADQLLWNAIIPLFSVMLGAWLAFRFDRKSRSKAQDEANQYSTAQLCFAVTLHKTAISQLTQFLETQKTEIMKRPIDNTPVDISYDFTDLGFMCATAPGVLHQVMAADRAYHVVVKALSEYNSMASHLFNLTSANHVTVKSTNDINSPLGQKVALEVKYALNNTNKTFSFLEQTMSESLSEMSAAEQMIQEFQQSKWPEIS